MSCSCQKITIFSADGPALKKIRVAARINKIELEEKPIDEADAEINPLKFAQVACLPCGTTLFGLNAILRTILRATPFAACCQLYGRSACEQALVDQWIDIAEEKVAANMPEILGQIAGSIKFIPKNYDNAVKNIKDVVCQLEKRLLLKTYVVGERCTMADIALAIDLAPAFQTIFGAAERAEIVNVTRWINTILGRCAVKEVCGEFTPVEEALAPKKPEKAKKPEKKEKAKEPEPEPEPEPETAPQEEEEPEPVEDPNAPLDMDWWKRLYSNTKPADYPEMWPKLWKKLDADEFKNFSLWYCEYKYPEDYTKTFMFSNLVSGFMQRLDCIRKVAFGTILILGQDPKLESSGVWLWKGTEMLPEMIDCPDYDSWTFRKIDPSKPEERKLFQEYCEWEGSFGGKNLPCADGKTFK